MKNFFDAFLTKKIYVKYTDEELVQHSLSFPFQTFLDFGFEPGIIFYLIENIEEYHVDYVSCVDISEYCEFDFSDSDYLKALTKYDHDMLISRTEV